YGIIYNRLRVNYQICNFHSNIVFRDKQTIQSIDKGQQIMLNDERFKTFRRKFSKINVRNQFLGVQFNNA
ncbi:unnamed protein product, partial (macronuclear) [Paramecium tetraurelia]